MAVVARRVSPDLSSGWVAETVTAVPSCKSDLEPSGGFGTWVSGKKEK